MIIYLVGLSCVGKTTIGRLLADRIGFTFIDIDKSVQDYYHKPIERIQEECLTVYGFREKASVVLDQVFSENIDSVVSGTPAGLKSAYLTVYKKHKKSKNLYSVHLYDTANNILNRLTFFDKDSNPIVVHMNESMRLRYLQEIRADYDYFRDSYRRADIRVDIEDVRLEAIPEMIIEELRNQNVELPPIGSVQQ